MSTKRKIGIGCGLAVLLVANSVQADINIAGDIEMNTDAVSNAGGDKGNRFSQGGRVKVAFSGSTETSRGYVKAVGQLLVNKDGSTGVDDAYIRFGSGQWGLQFGRFEAIDLFSKGVDTLYNVIGSNHYQANAARGRKGDDVGQIMFDFEPSDAIHFEVATLWGESTVADTDEGSFAGFRPAIKIDATDDLRITVGGEFVEDGETEISGAGLYVRYATDAFALKMNVASGKSETGDVTDWENTSFNVNVESGPFGVGYTHSEDDGGDSADTMYGNFRIANMLGIDGVTANLGASFGSSDDSDKDEAGVRFRLNYGF